MLQVLKRTMPYAFSMALVVTTVLLLIPSYAVPKAFDFYDKAQHALVFMSLTVVGLMAFPTRLKAVCIGLITYIQNLLCIYYNVKRHIYLIINLSFGSQIFLFEDFF